MRIVSITVISIMHYRQKIWNVFHFTYIWIFEVQRFKTNYFSIFLIRLWLELLLSLCQIAAITIRVLHRDMVHNIIVYLPPILVRSAGDYRRGGLALKDVGSSLGIPQGDVHKILIKHKQQIFSYRKEEAVSLKYLPLKIGPDVDMVCSSSSFLINIVVE